MATSSDWREGFEEQTKWIVTVLTCCITLELAHDNKILWEWNSIPWIEKCVKQGKQDLQKPIISDHVCISFYWGQICPWNNITSDTEKSPCWNQDRKKQQSWGPSPYQSPSMDGSIEGDINELSYSPIVVTVYFVWVCAVWSAYKMIRRHTGATSIVK